MSKYEKLWKAVTKKFNETNEHSLQFSLAELENMGGIKIEVF